LKIDGKKKGKVFKVQTAFELAIGARQKATTFLGCSEEKQKNHYQNKHPGETTLPRRGTQIPGRIQNARKTPVTPITGY